MSLPSDTEMRARHVAWAKARLRSPAAKASLRKNLEAGVNALLDASVATLVDADAGERLLNFFLSEPFAAKTVRPIVRTAVLLRMARLREAPEPLSTYVSDEARGLVEELLVRPGLLPEKFTRELLGHKAFEGIARDVLEDALTEFSSKVNPFTAEWGLPSLLKRSGPFSIGLGAFAKGLDTVREEFEKRLEPERRRFLQGFARRSLDTMTEFIIKRADDPQFLVVRKEVFAWLLEQPVSEVVSPASEKVTELSIQTAEALTRHFETIDGVRRRRRAALDFLLAAHRHQSVRDALATYGASVELDYDALTDAIWPALLTALDAPAIDAFVDDLVGGFYDEPI